MPAFLTPTLRRTLAAFALLPTTSVFAQKPPGEGKPEGSSWGVGIAVISAQKAYKGTDRETRALPMLSYENQYLKLSGPNVEAKLPGLDLGDSQRLKFSLVAKLFGGGGYEASDSPFLAGMAERKSSTWVGGKMEWENGVADLKLEWLADAASHSKGQRIVLGLDRKWMVGPGLMLIPQVSAEWADKKYVDYYYGVRTGEVVAGRAAYTGKATLNAEVGLTGMIRLDKQQSLMLNVGVKSLGKEIRNSPLVDRSTENRLMLGYQYRF
ncbi:MipA/OmpV family protein [Roseateles flavus]|uniref:MipA/OmpV family protein n=1 Tax=Roseateles flavus TaxID=3149041 RepID=A0ABV0G8C1_9BURK